MAKATIVHPPQYSATRRITGRARYLASGSTNTSITRGALLSHLFMGLVGGTPAGARLLTGFKLKSISIWGSTATLGSTVTASITWLSEQGPSSLISDTSVGTAEPLHVQSTPPAQSLAGFWSFQGQDESITLFNITAPANAVVDITYEAILQNGEGASGVTTTANLGTGVVYMAYLAGVTSTTFVPISYTTAT
jgi:hypothetical protein